jgi:outer membrane usher protein
LLLKPDEHLSPSTPLRLPEPGEPPGALRLAPSEQLHALPGDAEFLRAPPRPSAERIEELLVQTDVNRQNLWETVLVLRTPQGRLLISGEDLERWRLRKPDALALEHTGIPFYAVDALPGAHARFDPAHQTLEIEAGAEAFTETVASVRGRGAQSEPILPRPGAFMNYDLSASEASNDRLASGIFEVGFFSRYGVLTSSSLAADLGNQDSWKRLDTTYTIDRPAKLTSVRLGDSITRPGAWGRSVRFGGVQYGTNFNTQPGFIRFPAVSAAGLAALPSTVDVYVNNALVARRAVPPGPFSVTNVPVVTGAGDVRVVVRDILGREQIVTTPFYGSTTLLRAGITDYSYEIGTQRRDFSLESNHYSNPIGAATYRRGFSDAFTGEGRAEFDDLGNAFGSAAALRVGNFGVVSGTGALSHSDRGSGTLFGYGFERNTRRISLGLQTTLTTSQFRQTGMEPNELPRKRQVAANFGLELGGAGAISITRAMQEFRGDLPRIEVTTASYSVPVARAAQLNLSAVRTEGAFGGTTLFATVAVPLDAATSASAGVEHARSNALGTSERTATLAVQRSLPLGDGYGYRFQARNEEFTGRLEAQNAYGRWSAEAYKPEDADAVYRIGAAGGIGTIGGKTFLSRSITESFAVVRVADYPDVRVLQDNQPVGTTDRHGYVVLPRLRPYDRNPISIEQGDLPMDARIGSLRLEAVPYFRSGVLVDFPVQRVRAAVLRIILEDGGDVPSGAVARVDGAGEMFPIALRGQLYIEGVQQKSRIVVTWKGQTCGIDIALPKIDDPLPDLGTFVCKGVTP